MNLRPFVGNLSRAPNRSVSNDAKGGFRPVARSRASENSSGILLFLLLWLHGAMLLAQTNSITIQADQPGAPISPLLFGIFFEEINYGGEGGLYAEMVRNRSFDNSTSPDFWTPVTQGTATGQFATDTTQPLNANNLRALKLTMDAGIGSIGAANSGFWGMAIQAGARYELSLYVRAAAGFNGPLDVRLESSSGSAVYAQTAFSGLTTNWQRFASTVTANATDAHARLVVRLMKPATVWLDTISVFPQATFHDRTNGARPDLASMLVGLKPSFMRFPGGCYVEGNYLTNAFRWKNTIGDISARPGHWNSVWNYASTDGLGYHEYLQLCEDLETEPLFVINCGMAHNEVAPISEMGPWVQDAVDAIAYANAPTSSTWGALRAANGHPEPYNLTYIQIGNENGGTAYNDRYALFYDAIKSNYPSMRIISCVWGGTPTSRPLEIIDEHYYSSPATFVSYATKYDSYSRSGPKVYVGEYAVTQGYGSWGNMAAALGEAAFMTGMERNSDLVVMASYAPLFGNVNSTQWRPDLIYYDSSRRHGTPSYYVQQLFSQNRGDMVLPATVVTSTNALAGMWPGAIGVGSWNTFVQYSNVVVTSNGVTLYQSDFMNQDASGWQTYNGAWNVNSGLYQQTSSSTTDCRSTIGNTNWADYTLSLQARKVNGSEGFLILFSWLDNNNFTWWNIGGWNNTLTGIERITAGGKSLVGAQVSQTIATDVWYDVRIELSGPRIRCYLNSALVHDVTYSHGLLASASYDKTSGEVILKAVNPYEAPMPIALDITGIDSIASNATLIQLVAPSGAAENSLASPTNVFPVTSLITNAGTNFAATFPANSLSILRLQAAGIRFPTNLLLQVPSPINAGRAVSSTVWGQLAGPEAWINLTTNRNHAISYSSADTNLARVDVAGNVTGVDSGTTLITACYDSLGLFATQSVQVIGVPRALVHRYGFNEPSGSTAAADSEGGPAWDANLPNGGTFGGGQLALASASQQYVQFPSHILSNYPMVTIEAWVTFPRQLPVDCFFYGFGNSVASEGRNYIFCAPRAGRIAITDGAWSREQNAWGAGDLSYRTNLHFVAVYHPPAGYLALYTNGVLAAINNSVTVPLSAVNDVYNYIGKSLYSNDPYPDMRLDEFRIYEGVLRPNEIVATQALGPEQVLSSTAPTLRTHSSGTELVLSWPLAAASFALESCTSLASGIWTIVDATPLVVGDQWQVSLPALAEAEFFRLGNGGYTKSFGSK